MRADIHFSNLNRRRYAQNDDTLYVAPEDERTDYVCLLTYLLMRCLTCGTRTVPTADG